MTTYLCAKCQHVIQARAQDQDYILVEPCSECAAAHVEEVRELELEVERTAHREDAALDRLGELKSSVRDFITDTQEALDE